MGTKKFLARENEAAKEEESVASQDAARFQYPPIYEYGESAPMPSMETVGKATDVLGEGIRGVLEMPTFGVSNLAEKKARAIANYAMSGDPNTTYRQELAGVEETLRQSEEENYAARLAGNLVGGVGTGVGAAKLLSKAPDIAKNLFGTLGRRTAASTTAGTASNVSIEASKGKIESLEDLLSTAATGAIGGAAGNLLGEAAIPAARFAGQRVFPIAGINRFAKEGGKQTAKDFMEGAATPSGKNFASLYEDDPMTAGRLTNILENQPRSQGIADADPKLTSLTEGLARNPDTAGTARRLSDVSDTRIAGAPARARSILDDALPPGSSPAKMEADFKSRAQAATVTYDEILDTASAKATYIPFEVRELLDEVERAFSGPMVGKSRRAYETLVKSITSPHMLDESGRLTARGVFSLKKETVDLISENTLQSTGKEANVKLGVLSKSLTKMLHNRVPKLEKVNDVRATIFRQTDAAKEGRAALSPTSEPSEVKAIYSGLNKDDKSYFESALISDLGFRAAKAGDSKYITKEFAKGPTVIRAKLLDIFGPKKVDEIVDQAERLALEVANAKRFKAGLAGRDVSLGQDTKQITGQLAAASIGSSFTGAGPTIGPATQLGLLRRVFPAMDKVEQIANQELMSLMQLSGKKDVAKMRSLFDTKRGKMTPKASVAAGAIGGTLLD